MPRIRARGRAVTVRTKIDRADIRFDTLHDAWAYIVRKGPDAFPVTIIDSKTSARKRFDSIDIFDAIAETPRALGMYFDLIG